VALRDRAASARPVLPDGHDRRGGAARIGISREALPADDYERIEELVDLAPIREALVEALETLADEQRDALRLRVIDGLGYPEVAERLGCAEAAVRQRVSRGLRRIALVLQERGLSLATEVE
jgi:RNA polymerase sigma-70 factor (ECF subfamily)